MPEIIIHGASSFLGRHFSQKLMSEKHSFTVIARRTSNINYLNGYEKVNCILYNHSLDEVSNSTNLPNKPTFIEFSWNGVFGTERNNFEQISINIPLIISSINLGRRLHCKHWIGFGSQAEYGNLDKTISENDECNPVTMYGKAKYYCSQISKDLCSSLNINHSWLRLFSVYGPDDNHEWLIIYLIKKMLLNESIDVTKGDQKWDYLYVEDIISMLLKLVNTNGTGIANLGSGSAIQIKSIIEKIKILTNSQSIINYGAVPYRTDQVMNMEADITRLKTQTGWNPTTTIEEGLLKTINSLKM